VGCWYCGRSFGSEKAIAEMAFPRIRTRRRGKSPSSLDGYLSWMSLNLRIYSWFLFGGIEDLRLAGEVEALIYEEHPLSISAHR